MLSGKPGRFAVDGMDDWWVLWADGDYRTLVIGTPSGRFGFVLNRESLLPADRLRAVRDIVRFNGYRSEDMAVF
jgi:apolipoprotein D and lipocalin family protein